MQKSKKRIKRETGQWPVAVTLVICALFAAVIALKTKSEYNNYKTNLFQSLATSADIASARVDSNVLISVAKLGSLQANNELAIQGASHSGSEIQSIASFNPDGTLAKIGNGSTRDLVALSAASQLANETGWIGAIARGTGTFAPAIAKRFPDNSSIAAILQLNNILSLKDQKFLIIADRNGAIVANNGGNMINGAKNVTEAFGISFNGMNPMSTASYGSYAKNQNGNKMAIGVAPSRSGYWVIIGQPRSVTEPIWNHILIFYLLLFLGPILAFIGIWAIVTGQSSKYNQAQEQMREAERRLKIAIDGAKCGIWDWDIGSDNVFLSERLSEAFGLGHAGRYSTNEVLKALREDDQIRMRAALRATMQIGSIDIIVQLKPKPAVLGQLRPPSHIQLRGRGATDKGDPNSLRVLGVSIDVSEQMYSESRVAAAERRLRDALDSMSGPFALWSKGGALVLWNEAFAYNFSLDATVLRAGAKYEEVSKVAARNIVSQRTDKFDAQAQEIELKNGKWLRLVERRTSDNGLVSIGIDITPQKETEAEALRSERQLREVVTQLQKSEREAAELAQQYEKEKIRAEEASASKNSFLANMSHELRTPLNAINGFSQMMAEEIFGPLGDQRYVDYARDILDSGRHLLDLINDVLDMAKIEAGKFKIYAQPMSLNESIDQAVRVVRGRAEEKHIDIERDLGDIDDMIGDARAVKQIFINLLSNAIKFTEENGRVLIRTRYQRGFAVISIIDTGIGISEENLPRLGRAFEQVENEHARTNQGTGLGLALCRSFAQMHGGSMTINSKLGVGTKVDVILPKEAQVIEEAA